jgi:phytoene synthase
MAARSWAVFDGRVPETPQGVALQPFVEPFHLPRAQFEALVDGVAMDGATPQRYRSFHELEPYCHRVASSVGLMCAEIFGYTEPRVKEYARDLGRSAAVDQHSARRGGGFQARPRLPAADELGGSDARKTTFAGSRRAPARHVRSPAVRALLEFQATRAL